MIGDHQDPITDLLINLANSVQERHPTFIFTFNEAEKKLVENWMILVLKELNEMKPANQS